MATSKNRYELEEKRKKQKLKLVQDALKKADVSGTAQKLSNAAQTIKKNTTKSTGSTTAAVTGAPKTNTGVITSTSTPLKTTTAKTSVFQELPKLVSTVQDTAKTVLQGTQKSNDLRQLQQNSIAWHGTTDAATRSSLQKQNNTLRAKLGLSYDPKTGSTFDAKTGMNYSTPTQLLFGSTAGTRANTAAQAATSSTVRGVTDEMVNRNKGANAHRTMADLYNRSAETWSKQDTKNRDEARQALVDEMGEILRAYGMTYSARSTGPNAAYTVSDDEAIDRLRKAGADETTLAYVQENIDMRNRADRLGRGVEAAAKRFIAGIPALIETSEQNQRNLEQSRENPEYAALEAQEQRLIQQMNSIKQGQNNVAATVEYMKVYNELQEVQKKKNALAVTTPVDPNKWGQTKLREAAEAQADATAGLAPVPRFLAETGISIAGNVPTMALAAVPVAGVAAGATLTGLNAAGQRAAELNAQGVSPGEALGRGVASGVIEAVTEKLPLDEMANLLKTGGTKAVWNILRQMGVEAGEESASYLMNYVSDLAANDPDAEFSFAELAQSALGGAVSGGVFGTAGTVIGGRRTGTDYANIPENIRMQQADAAASMAQEAMQVAQAETLLTRNDIIQQGSAPRGMEANPYIGMPQGMLQSRLAEMQRQYWGADAQTQQEMLADMSRLSEAMDSETAQTANSQALGARMAELDAQKRQAESALRQAQTTQAKTPAQTQAEVQIPADAAFQYGKTPEQAALEARERARNEAAQAARDQQIVQDMERSEGAIRSDNPYYGLTRQQLENELAFAKQRIERARKDKNSDKAGRLLNQYRQIEQAIEAAQAVSFKAGDRVFALDRNNFGEIVKDLEDGYFDVYFVNTKTGEAGIHTLHGDLLQSIMPGEDVPRVTPQEAAERAGEIYDYSPEAFDRMLEENEMDQYADLPARDFSRFGNGKLRDGMGQDEQIRRDIEEMANEADQQGQKQIIPESVALNIDRVKMAYNKTLERVLDEAAGKSKVVRQVLQDTIERPLAAAKSLYARSIKSQIDGYYKDMKETGIKLGSKESAAVMWYGEGKRMNEAGEYVDYTLADLKRDFPNKWKDIVKADSINRRIYDEYIGKIQQARRAIYPYAEQRVELGISRKRAQAAAFSEQVKNLDAKIAAGSATPADMASRNQLMRELQAAEKDIAQRIKDRDSGKAFANQRLFPRKDYYHHAMEMSEGFSSLKNIIETDMSIDPRLVGTSDNTKPKAKWSGILQKRKGVKAMEDSVGAMLDYIPQAEYMINIDPQVARLRTVVRDLVDGTANADQTNANSLIEWLTDYTNDLAGKTNPFDRALQKVFSRKLFKAIEWINGRAKSNAILGNLNSAVAQVYNLPNGLAYVKDPRDISRGMTDFVAAKVTDGEARRALDESGFMTERYLDSATEQFDESLLHKPKQFATWLLTAGDEQVSQMIWFSAYEQAKRKGVSDPIFYADDMTKRAVAGRGVGEVPLMQKAKLVKLIAPFQVEVSNAYYVLKEKVGAKDAIGLTLLFLSTFLLNEVKEDLTGTRTGMDLIDAGSDAIKEVLDPDYEGGVLSKIATVGGRLGGEVLSNMPFGAQIASTLISDETQREKLFGESDPTRFGTGNIGIDALVEPVSQFVSGQQVNPWDVVTGILLPWGGKQVSRGIDMAEDYGLLPVFRVSQDGVRLDRQETNAAYSEDGSQLKYVADTDVGNILKGLAFGRYATDAGKEYIDNGMKMLSKDKTEAFKKGVTEQGIDEETLYDAIIRMSQAEAVKDETGKTITSAKEAARRLLFERGDMTPEQKQWLDEQLLIDPESDQKPADYSNYTNFVLSMYDSEDRREVAEQAVEHGLTVDQFVQWDDRLKDVKGMKDRNDKSRYTDAEARGMVLDEVLADSALSDSEKEAIADYVLISSMTDTQREKWDAARGQVNATDFLRFKDDVAAYESEYAQTGADNAANVAQILRGYDGMTDEQRDVLYQTYSDNMGKNPFHVSEYEKNLAGNSFYTDLTDEGKAELRSLANEYEQTIDEGKELSDWQGKAYMAKEAGIAPETYILYRVALNAANEDGKGSAKQSEAEIAVNLLPGLTQQQKAYLYQSTNTSWKSNPFGSATVTKYNEDAQEAINPVAGGTLSSSFGPRTSPTAGASSWHKAVDIAAPAGTPVQAVKGGTVTSAGWVNGYGWTVHIDHGDGTETEYHHMQAQSDVKPGDTVTQGQQIGAVGSTGISTGPHLDLQAWQDGKIVDPLTIIPEYGSASGYVYDGTVSAGVVSSGRQASSGSSGSSGASGSSGNSGTTLKKLKGFQSLPTF